jgi:nucleotide-binding universal stress UspA family protein
MLHLKRIMVPIDFSCCSRKALQYAVLFAKDYGAGVVLIHVVEDPSANSRLLEQRKSELETLAGQEVCGGVPVSTLVKAGDPLREIVDAAAERSIDLLLVSTHARAGLPDLCLDSGAEQIVRYAQCPVLVVREEEHDFIK